MTTTHSNSDLFNVFIEAKQALDELPAVKAAHESAVAELGKAQHTINDHLDALHAYELQIAELRATLAAKEEALSQATFRESQAEGKLNIIIGLLVPPGVVAAPAVTADEVGSRAQAAASEAGTGLSERGQSDADPTSSVATDHGETVLEASASSFGTVKNIDNLTESRGGDESRHNHTPEASPVAIVGEGGAPSVEQSSTSTSSAKTIGGDGGDNLELRGGLDQTVPPSPRPFWSKPDAISWPTWIAQGNQPAPWLNADGSQKIDPSSGQAAAQ
jgi:hypothetical protein